MRNDVTRMYEKLLINKYKEATIKVLISHAISQLVVHKFMAENVVPTLDAVATGSFSTN